MYLSTHHNGAPSTRARYWGLRSKAKATTTVVKNSPNNVFYKNQAPNMTARPKNTTLSVVLSLYHINLHQALTLQRLYVRAQPCVNTTTAVPAHHYRTLNLRTWRQRKKSTPTRGYTMNSSAIRTAVLAPWGLRQHENVSQQQMATASPATTRISPALCCPTYSRVPSVGKRNECKKMPIAASSACKNPTLFGVTMV